MNDFPEPESLSTLADARETYGKLLAAFNQTDEQTAQLRGELAAASELLSENAETLAKLQEQYSAQTGELEQARHDLGNARQTIQAHEANAEKLEAQVAQLEASAQSAEEQAASICASVGVDPLQIQPESQSTQPDLMEQFQSIKDPGQRTAFFRKHKDQLLSRL